MSIFSAIGGVVGGIFGKKKNNLPMFSPTMLPMQTPSVTSPVAPSQFTSLTTGVGISPAAGGASGSIIKGVDNGDLFGFASDIISIFTGKKGTSNETTVDADDADGAVKKDLKWWINNAKSKLENIVEVAGGEKEIKFDASSSYPSWLVPLLGGLGALFIVKTLISKKR